MFGESTLAEVLPGVGDGCIADFQDSGSDSGNAFPARNNVASGTSSVLIDLRKLLISAIFSFLLVVASTL